MSLSKQKIIMFSALFIATAVSLLAMLYSRQTSAACSKSTSYTVVIRDGEVSPVNTSATICDTIVFINQDKTPREIAFGPHEEHVAYDGVSERLLNQNQSFKISLMQKGSFHFHDHLNDAASGYFTVN